eukprot:TRINITY_DN16463_c0_g1_i1.p1 TRINITY_DN16463_c0_g1~~TRINITY_DN16463_c0_g1_i1.p1  ORF type:complete len:340 (+),score=74.00 TRINITY_DN16463_c0_g1_i1:86-1105(+)
MDPSASSRSPAIDESGGKASSAAACASSPGGGASGPMYPSEVAAMQQMRWMQAMQQAATFAAAGRGYPFPYPGMHPGMHPEMQPGLFGMMPMVGGGQMAFNDDTMGAGGQAKGGKGFGKGYGKGFGKGFGKGKGKGKVKGKGFGKFGKGGKGTNGEEAGAELQDGVSEGGDAQLGEKSETSISDAQRAARLRFEKDVLDRLQGRWQDADEDSTTYLVDGNLCSVSGGDTGRVFRNRLFVFGHEMCWDARRFWHYLDLKALFASGDTVERAEWKPAKDSPPTREIVWLKLPDLPDLPKDPEAEDSDAVAEDPASGDVGGVAPEPFNSEVAAGTEDASFVS